MGQLFMMGFDGTSVNPQIRSLIENHYLGSVLLSAKNLKCIIFFSSSFLNYHRYKQTNNAQPQRRQRDWFSNYKPSPGMRAIRYLC